MNPAAGSGEENLRSALNKAELEALEALKLQYFQNATRSLAKGDYDNALAEIKRVLLIDPEHRLAREYEIRVTELQASRAQVQNVEPPPPDKEVPHVKETPHPAPATLAATGPAASPRRASGKTWLYVGLIALLLVGTAGVLTLEKVNDEEEQPVTPVAAVSTPVLPVEQTTESATVEPTPSIVQPAALAEPKQNHVAEPRRTSASDEKSVPTPEPVRREQPPASSAKTAPAGRGLLAAVTEKKVEPPPAPVNKEVPLPQPEIKPVSTQSPPPEPVAPSAPFVAVEREPKLLRLEKVRLPDIALRTNPSGEMKVKVLVDKEGKAQQVQIVSSTNSLLDQAVIDALQKSSYAPGVMGNDPVSAWLVIPLKFK